MADAPVVPAPQADDPVLGPPQWPYNNVPPHHWIRAYGPGVPWVPPPSNPGP